MKGKNLSTFSRVGLAAAAVLAAGSATPAAAASARYHRCAPQSAYVANFGSDTVTPISTRTNTAGPAITVGALPGAIAITPDRNPAYP